MASSGRGPTYYDRVFDWGITGGVEVAGNPKTEGRLKVWEALLVARGVAPRSILDLGCSDGSVARELAQRGIGSEFTLIDISQQAVDYVNEQGFPGLVEARVADIYALPYGNDAFDLAILSHTAEHLSHPRDAIVEAARVASLVLVEVPLEDAVLSNAAAWARKRRTRFPRSMNAVGHLHFFSDATFRCSIEQWDLVTVLGSVRYAPASESWVRRALATALPAHLYGKLLTTNAAYLVCRRRHQAGRKSPV